VCVEAATPVCGQRSGCVCGERDLGEGDEISLRGSSVPVCIGRLDLCVQWWRASRGLGLCP